MPPTPMVQIKTRFLGAGRGLSILVTVRGTFPWEEILQSRVCFPGWGHGTKISKTGERPNFKFLSRAILKIFKESPELFPKISRNSQSYSQNFQSYSQKNWGNCRASTKTPIPWESFQDGNPSHVIPREARSLDPDPFSFSLWFQQGWERGPEPEL